MHYTFLFHFGNISAGAWEHSYSSEYVCQEMPLATLQDNYRPVVAHEFLHILTPLKIHSELVAKFNFVKPVMSRHLWFYEGVTDLGVHCTEMQDQYLNIYMKGAIVAGLLDIKLLQLSHEKRELRKVIHQLSQIYGPNKSFSEKIFFLDFTKLTYPEIGDFFS